jgi:hypothetical protein
VDAFSGLFPEEQKKKAPCATSVAEILQSVGPGRIAVSSQHPQLLDLGTAVVTFFAQHK